MITYRGTPFKTVKVTVLCHVISYRADICGTKRLTLCISLNFLYHLFHFYIFLS